jgi:hypothetical protein
MATKLTVQTSTLSFSRQVEEVGQVTFVGVEVPVALIPMRLRPLKVALTAETMAGAAAAEQAT